MEAASLDREERLKFHHFEVTRIQRKKQILGQSSYVALNKSCLLDATSHVTSLNHFKVLFLYSKGMLH